MKRSFPFLKFLVNPGPPCWKSISCMKLKDNLNRRCRSPHHASRCYQRRIVVANTLVFYLNEYWIELNQAKLEYLNWIFWEKILLNKFLNWIFLKKIILNIPLNWILPWNEWMNHILNRYLPFLMKSPLFCLFWTLFGQFLGNYPIRPELMIPWLLNWIIFWIESADFFWNWIIFWIKSWVKQYWIE